MSEQQGYSKLAQLLATADIQSILSENYSELILDKEGNINYKISADTFLGSTKEELLGYTILHLAYKKNKLQLFNLLLSHGANINLKDQTGCTVLHQIIQDSYEKEAECSELPAISDNSFVTSVLDRFVKSEYSGNPRNGTGLTHFHIACMANHVAAVELFLKNAVHINRFVFNDSPIFPGYTALHFAARFSNLEIVEMLLEHDTARNLRNAAGLNPLHMLLKQNIEIAGLLNKDGVANAKHLATRRKANEDIIHLLLDRTRVKIDVIDDTNISRLHIACIMESSQIPEDLLGDAAYINRAINSRSPVFAGNTALHFAALCDVKKVKLLLKKGSDIRLLNAKNQTALDLCIERYEIQDIHNIISSQPNWSKKGVADDGETMLDLLSCLRTGDLSVLRKRKELDLNTFVSRRSLLWSNYDLLHLAVVFSERGCKNDSMTIKRVAREDSISTNPVAKDGITPLHLAFRLRKPKVVDFLLNTSRSTVNCADSEKLSHLHVACAAGNAAAVEKLLLNGAEVNGSVQASFEWFRHSQCPNESREVCIPKGATPLHVAVIVGHCETMRILVGHRADLYAKDEYGMTPIHWLIVSGNPVSPAAEILLNPRPVGSTSEENGNKRVARTSTLRECITNTGFSHLHVACFANNKAAVEQLLADGRPFTKASEKSADYEAKVFQGDVRYAGYSPLNFALEAKSKEIVGLLIEHGASILMRNPITKSIPLFEAFVDKSSVCSEVFAKFFRSNKDLQQQIESYTGLTMLHFYCCELDDEAAESLLKDGAADVNGRIRWDSPIWPGYTPLHVLISCYDSSSRSADTLLQLLLHRGADVTLVDFQMNSPLHLAYNLDVETDSKASILETLLRSQNNFTVNPQNRGKLSHFHIACALGDDVAIENFLLYNVDVNQPVDYFYTDSESRGCTPLHLVLFHPLNQKIEMATKLRAITALIESAADVRAEDSLGNTPLHFVAKYLPRYVSLLKKIVDVGGDIYAKNILAQTPFEIMLSSKNRKAVTVVRIKFFLDSGYCANAFNPVTQKGFMAAEFRKPALKIFKNSCKNVLDETGRTIIHNVVSTSTPAVSDTFYIDAIECFAKVVDIDHQDKQGRTALHIATQFNNHQAVFALLQAGADVNILCSNSKTAFDYAFETSPFFDGSQDDSAKVVKTFSSYIQKLNVCLLDVHEKNHSALAHAFRKFNVDFGVNQCFYDELQEMKKIKIGLREKIILLKFISGMREPFVSSCISQMKRGVIDHFLQTVDKTRFCESVGVIRFRCRQFTRTH